jgi:hypothetical protein
MIAAGHRGPAGVRVPSRVAREDGRRARRRAPRIAPVTPVLVWTATAVALVLAVLGGLSTLAGRRIGLAHWIGSGVLEAVLLVQAVVAVVGLTGGHRLTQTATFYGYLAGVLVVPVIGLLWAWSERTRWAGTQVAVAALATAIMVWRLVQVWGQTRA